MFFSPLLDVVTRTHQWILGKNNTAAADPDLPTETAEIQRVTSICSGKTRKKAANGPIPSNNNDYFKFKNKTQLYLKLIIVSSELSKLKVFSGRRQWAFADSSSLTDKLEIICFLPLCCSPCLFFGVKDWKASPDVCRAARCGRRLSVEDSFNNVVFHRVTADDRARQTSGPFSGQLHPSAAK